MQKYRSPFSALLQAQPTWAAEGGSSTNPTYLKMPHFKTMVYKYKVFIDRDYCTFGKSPTCFLLRFLRSYPRCILGLYLDKASGIGFTSLAAPWEQLFY